jgi:iodotyrosine deiodinase
MASEPRPRFVAYQPLNVPEGDMAERARAIHAEMDVRRSIRDFSDRPVSRGVIETAIAAASTAPSGAHRQPWRFVLVGDPEVKRRIREAAEAEEYENYEGGRIPPHWREALAPLGTDWRKPFLETAPWIVVVFEERFGVDRDGSKRYNFYVKESVGIACGFFIVTLHRLGLVTLTHTPSPMAFLTTLLGRPANERPFILFPIGYPANDAMVPDLTRKSLSDIMVEVTVAEVAQGEGADS